MNEKIPSFEERFFAQNPSDDEKAQYFIVKQKAKEEEAARNSEFKLFQEMTEQIQSVKNRKVIDTLNSSMVSTTVGGGWTTKNG